MKNTTTIEGTYSIVTEYLMMRCTYALMIINLEEAYKIKFDFDSLHSTYIQISTLCTEDSAAVSLDHLTNMADVHKIKLPLSCTANGTC